MPLLIPIAPCSVQQSQAGGTPIQIGASNDKQPLLSGGYSGVRISWRGLVRTGLSFSKDYLILMFCCRPGEQGWRFLFAVLAFRFWGSGENCTLGLYAYCAYRSCLRNACTTMLAPIKNEYERRIRATFKSIK